MAYGNSFQRTTPVVMNLIIINTLVFFAQWVLGGLTPLNNIDDLFALHHYKADVFKPYQVVTHMFMHGSFFHLLANMFGLWMFGSMMERIWGPKRFILFYLACGVAAALVQMGSYAYEFWQVEHMAHSIEWNAEHQELLRMNCTVGASGAIMGILAAFGYLFPNTEMMIIPIPVPVKAKWLITGIILIDVFSGFSRTQGDNIAHFAHVGGAIAGFLIVFFWNRTNRQTFY